MGTMVAFDSAELLLQREDQPAALAALRAHLRDCPGDLEGDTPMRRCAPHASRAKDAGRRHPRRGGAFVAIAGRVASALST
ncbi:hypothetical protein OHA72_24060 [Dactylosporangium sp. NBC_01737]|uniref:hypothetical protein n=1 Tax=Dactylosporangium sp. NBC_01737 TaxID=2975959 RepID=UPI002E14C0F6|nr:hypothetical protein OHA72_24060 [Dactylosporangium sp. NBC_01737]